MESWGDLAELSLSRRVRGWWTLSWSGRHSPRVRQCAVAHELVVQPLWQIMYSVARYIFKKGVKQPNNYLYQLRFILAASNRNLKFSRHLRHRFIFLSCKINLKVGSQGLV